MLISHNNYVSSVIVQPDLNAVTNNKIKTKQNTQQKHKCV